MATVWSSPYQSGTYTTTEVRVDYSGTSATAHLLYTRTNNWNGTDKATNRVFKIMQGNTEIASRTYSISFPGKARTREELTSLSFTISTSGGTYTAISDTTNTFKFSGSFTIPSQSYTNTVNHWAWGFKNGEGNNGSRNALHLTDTTFSRTVGASFQMNQNDAIAIPRGYYLDNTFGSGCSGTWKGYPMGTSFTQQANGMSFEYDYRTNNYNISYNLNGGSNSSNNPSSYTILYGVTFSNPSRTGYNFSGWKIDGSWVNGINPGANASFSNWTDMTNKIKNRTIGNKTAVAYWTPKQYYIDVNGRLGKEGGSYSNETNLGTYGTVDVFVNGSKVGSNVTDYYTKHDYDSSFRIEPHANRGYTYNGVYEGSLSGTIHGTISTRLTFTKNKYTVTYNANGGTGAPGNQIAYYGDYFEFTSQQPSKSGYDFIRWYSTSGVTWGPNDTASDKTWRWIDGDWDNSIQNRILALTAEWRASKPTNVSVSADNITINSIDVHCHATGKEISKYIVHYRENGSSQWNNLTITNGSSATINNLIPETTYDIYITAYNPGGNTDSSIITVTTLVDQAKIYIKIPNRLRYYEYDDNSNWVQGKAYYKKDGQWIKAKKVYIKKDGQWIINKNS